MEHTSTTFKRAHVPAWHQLKPITYQRCFSSVFLYCLSFLRQRDPLPPELSSNLQWRLSASFALGPSTEISGETPMLYKGIDLFHICGLGKNCCLPSSLLERVRIENFTYNCFLSVASYSIHIWNYQEMINHKRFSHIICTFLRNLLYGLKKLKYQNWGINLKHSLCEKK